MGLGQPEVTPFISLVSTPADSENKGVTNKASKFFDGNPKPQTI